MFKEARIKLTAWYLLIIMGISLSFSGAIYIGINRELTRLANFQRARIMGIVRGFPVSFDVTNSNDMDAINEARLRIITTLGLINLFILVFSGLGGYFLAGQTLDPIADMVEEQKDFVSNASHELRTPLTSLRTEIEVALRSKNLKLPDAKNILKSNLEDIERMQKLTNYLLKMNRYESGTDLKLVKLDLKNIAIKAIGNMKVKTNLVSSVVTANEDSLVELITILLDNAFKYGNGKEIEVRVKNSRIEVTDHGMGIAKEDIPHIFKRFYRSDKSHGTDGYGLGLSIAKRIAELNGGAIGVRSELGKGSTFMVNF